MNTDTTPARRNAAGMKTGVFSRLATGMAILVTLTFVPALEAQDFDQLGTAIAQGQFGNLKAVIISRHGEIVYEDYFRGSQADDLHQVQSVTKSIGSALLGIAHRQGKIRAGPGYRSFFW